MTANFSEDRFSLLEMDGPAEPAKSPVTRPVAAPAAKPVTRSVTAAVANSVRVLVVESAEVVDSVRVLATAEADLAREHGFDVTDVDSGLFYAAGTDLMGVGHDKLAALDAEYRGLPTLAEAAVAHAATVAGEERKTSAISLRDWRMDAAGKLRKIERTADGRITFGAPAIAIDDNALGQLRSYYPHARARKLAVQGIREIQADTIKDGKVTTVTVTRPYPATEALPVPAVNVNGWLGDVATDNRIRARTHRGQREIFSVHSKSTARGYTEFDTDKLLAEASKIAGDLRCELTYDADDTRLRARCVAQAPIDIPAFSGVGRVHRIGFDLCAADNGTMSLQVGAFLVRVRCRNATLVEHAGKRARFRHIGKLATLRDSMEQALTRATESIDAMRALWARAATEHYLDTETGAQLSAPEAIARLVAGEYLPTGGLSADAAVDRYVAAWRAEDSPHSSMGVIMAVQRAAHESTWSTRWASDEIEEVATGLLYQKVYALDAPVAIEMA